MGALSSWRISVPSKGTSAAQLPHQWKDLTFFVRKVRNPGFYGKSPN